MAASRDDYLRAGLALAAIFLMEEASADAASRRMQALIVRLFPICRSITGDGVRETLRILREHVPLEIHEVPTGTQVFDWTVPREWNIRDAWIKNAAGERMVDFQRLNLHVLNYSVPVRCRMRLAELKNHLFTVPSHPDWVPYRTSYYAENWGFCVSENQLAQFREDEEYDVCIDSSLADGYLTYGEYLLEGEQSEEFLISCHVCHPSLANDNLSGISLAVELARLLAAGPRRYSYRFLFIPGTIGSVAWLALNEEKTANIKHGLVLTCLGDSGPITYKRSRLGNAEIDRAVEHVLKSADRAHCVIDFHPYGYDERQYCSPGFNLPVGCLMRSHYGKFPEYHTSADNLSFIQPQYLGDSFARAWAVIQLLEKNRTYVNQNPKCEPRLGKRGLYSGVGGAREGTFSELALLWVLNLSDGEHDLLAIAERSCMNFGEISSATSALQRCGLLEERPA